MSQWQQDDSIDSNRRGMPQPQQGYGDPFSDDRSQYTAPGAGHIHFQESQPGTEGRRGYPLGPYGDARGAGPSPAASSITLPHGPEGYVHDDEDEKIPLTGHGSYYPPNIDPDSFGVPGRPMSTVSSGSNNTETAWRHRQTIKRGVTRKVKLTSGNFIAEYPVPKPVYEAIEGKWKDNSKSTEFTHMRYTAATCDPDFFTLENGWKFRTSEAGRPTELLIAVTSYNEDKALYSRTLHGVMLNIRDICKTKSSKYWRRSAEEGLPPWQRITVALIVDGLEPMDKSVLDILATIGVYQDGVMKQKVDDKETVAHIFEYTTQISVDATPALILPHGDDANNLVPVQIILVLKAKNQKKINSHRWLFNAIGKHLQPEICVLLDAGTKPGHKAIYYLWEAFYNDPHLGGACGEIHAMLSGGRKLINPLVAAQNFEYKLSNILDKPLESSFGYVSVLPGAFSAYRYKAIQGRPLEQYFHGDHSLAERLGKKGINGMNIFTKNMFLAEDRILCFELVAKANDRWVLAYVKPSKAETDVPESAPELISQRRRWLNGSFAASIYALVHFTRLYRSGHGLIRMFFFHVQAVYNILTLVFTWFALANLWLTFSIVVALLPVNGIDLFGTEAITQWVNLSFGWIYLSALALQFVLALGNRPKGEKALYVLTMVIFAFLSLYLIVCSVLLSIKAFGSLHLGNLDAVGVLKALFTGPANVLLAALVATFGIYFIASVIYRDPWHMFTSFPQYLLLAPSFINVLNVYAFCNLHDVSWGTKGSDKAEVLPSVSSKGKKDSGGVVEDVTKSAEELDSAFKETVTRAVTKVKTIEGKEKPTADDQNRTFRTRLVAAWMLSNAFLAISIENASGLVNENESNSQLGTDLVNSRNELRSKQSTYFSVILWSTFALSLIKFTGFLFFWFKRNLFRCFRRN